MNGRTAIIPLSLAALALAGVLAFRPASQPSVAQAAGPELAVYNQGVALVKETRTLPLKAGAQSVVIKDVAAQIDPSSVQIRSLTDPSGLSVIEQDFEYDLVGAERLLSKYVDQPIQVVTKDGSKYAGTLLSSAGDITLRDEKGQIVVVSRAEVRDFSFPKLPEGLITRPSLVWLVQAAKDGSQDVELTYLTGGLSWAANYVLLLAKDGKSVDLDGWVTLDNQSGATYKDAKLKLVAGNINQVQPMLARAAEKEGVGGAAPALDSVQQRNFFEYHLYEIQNPVTVQDKQTKQIEFVHSPAVPAEKFYVYDGAEGYGFYGSPQLDRGYGADTGIKTVRTMLAFSTGPEGANAQLPKGTVRVYQQDTDGSALLLGEDSIDHTPKGEQVRLYIGDAFDIVGERVQTDFKQIGDTAVQESYKITLRNHKAEAVQVRVTERLYRWSDWTITEESAEHTKLDAQTVEWRLDIPADGEASLTYTVLYRW